MSRRRRPLRPSCNTVSILKRALPDYAEEDIFWGYHFVTGAFMNALARTGRIDNLSGGVCHSDDFDAVKRRIARFMAAGFLALGPGSGTSSG
jgi:tetracycline repressor-like protein